MSRKPKAKVTADPKGTPLENTPRPYLILRPEEHALLGKTEFGMPGLRAIESIGPFTEIQASGPLITVHDATVEPHLGIGHHPHRFNERLFYIEQGELDHDDAQNDIRGHISSSDLGQFTEGRGGMLHSEWNNGDIPTRAYILVYSTDPVPATAAFHILKDAEAPRYSEGRGVQTKELVGEKSPLHVNGDIRLLTDSRLEDGAELNLAFAPGEGGLVSVREGRVRLAQEGEVLSVGETLIAPPADVPRTLVFRANAPSRVIRVVYGPGHGLVRAAPRYRTRTRA
jgi:redox-sensitive bicupin YhaK (pirin superfamily)